jgi:hypothetical protein
MFDMSRLKQEIVQHLQPFSFSADELAVVPEVGPLRFEFLAIEAKLLHGGEVLASFENNGVVSPRKGHLTF